MGSPKPPRKPVVAGLTASIDSIAGLDISLKKNPTMWFWRRPNVNCNLLLTETTHDEIIIHKEVLTLLKEDLTLVIRPSLIVILIEDKLLKKSLSTGQVFGSEGLAINIAVYDENVDVEFLPLYCKCRIQLN